MKKEKITNSNLNNQYPVGVAWHATQNKQPHVGAGPVSAQNAITLVALVITIVVLLILAGVTINLTIGNNGIFQTAQKAAKNYTEAQNKELANLKEFENTVEKVTQNPLYNPSLLKLKPGDYVKYDTGVKEVGNNGVVTFRVLYDATSEYGLQIISDKNIENITLGGSNWESGKESYNNAIATLNDEAMKYKNDTYAVDARCVGSNPANKNAETTTTVKLPPNSWTGYTRPAGWINDDTECKDMDINYATDQVAMNVAMINKTGKIYWLASRLTNMERPTDCFFLCYLIDEEGGLQGNPLCRIQSNGITSGSSYSRGLRPCITLKPDINVTSGDGASEATAYTLGV